MDRVRLFETVDQDWIPIQIRDSIIESLGRTLAWGRMLSGIAAPFASFVQRAAATEVLELASGAGGPAALLVDELERAGVAPPRFLLTDRCPHVEAWERICARRPDRLAFLPEPVDATRIEPALSAGRPRVLINAFHHFEPRVARDVLHDAVESSGGIFISEIFDGNPLRLLSIAVPGVAAAIANPVLSPRHNVQKAVLTWLLPVVLVAGTWDAFVSTLRSYREPELRAMIEDTGDRFEWTHGWYRFGALGRGYYFYGVPRGR